MLSEKIKMKKELTMMLLIALALIADWLCFRQIFLKEPVGYLRFSYIVLLIAGGAGLFGIFGFFIKRLFAREA
jgi:hypothetical protein